MKVLTLIIIGLLILSLVVCVYYFNNGDEIKNNPVLKTSGGHGHFTTQDLVDYEIESGRGDEIICIGNKINNRGEDIPIC